MSGDAVAAVGGLEEPMLINPSAQDMHYADFAEDEVSNFVRLPATSHVVLSRLTDCRA